MGASASRTYGVSTSVRGPSPLPPFLALMAYISHPPSLIRTIVHIDTAVWTQIKPDTVHRRLSHSSAQVGSYLFISGGHDGAEYTPELLLFNLGEFFPPISPHLYTKQYVNEQCPCNMSLARRSERRPHPGVIMPRCSPIRGSSFSAGSTDMTSLTTCTYSTSPPQRTSHKSQASASTHNDTYRLSLTKTKGDITFHIYHVSNFSLVSCNESSFIFGGQFRA